MDADPSSTRNNIKNFFNFHVYQSFCKKVVYPVLGYIISGRFRILKRYAHFNCETPYLMPVIII